MRIYTLFSVLFFSLLSSVVIAQELIVPLQQNNTIITFLENHPQKNVFKKQSPADTLELPLMDDFSIINVYPDTSMWVDSTAFVNATFPENPPTIGVATLDGINALGKPYNNVYPTSHGIADHLTSRKINLNLNIQDSVYLSFFYQAEGLGEKPDPQDSLIVEFKDARTDFWYHVWSVPGRSKSPFKQVMIPVKDTLFLKKGFQFRFKNYATLSGNLDHWHIDYVRLNKNRSVADTILYNEVAFLDQGKSFIKTYESMPWSHYAVDSTKNIKDSVSYRLRNNDITPANAPYKYMVYDEKGNLIYDHQLDAGNTTSIQGIIENNISVGTATPPFEFPIDNNDSALFTIKHFIAQKGNNDTVIYKQNFHNYYAYDDGTAEYGYGLNASGGRIALRFVLAKSDTLRGVQMYFNPIIQNVSSRRFKIMVWKTINPIENIIYEGREVNPVYTGSINGFHTYKFDTTMVVSGEIFIGWQQLTSDLLNIGLDRNTDNTAQMFYNTNGTWNNSFYKGSWMIRPLFGKRLPSLVGIYNDADAMKQDALTIYPNPANDTFQLQGFLPNQDAAKMIVRIYDLRGRMLSEQSGIHRPVDVSSLSNGLYIIHTIEPFTSKTYFSKLMINR